MNTSGILLMLTLSSLEATPQPAYSAKVKSFVKVEAE